MHAIGAAFPGRPLACRTCGARLVRRPDAAGKMVTFCESPACPVRGVPRLESRSRVVVLDEQGDVVEDGARVGFDPR